MTGDVDIVEHGAWHQSTPGQLAKYQNYLFKSDISDIIIGESCDGDMEIESGGEVGTLVS